MSPMRRVRMLAINAPPAPTTIASSEMTDDATIDRRVLGWRVNDASAGSSDGATGKPPAGFNGIGSPSDTRRSRLRLLFAEHRRRGEVDVRFAQPLLEQVRERRLLAAGPCV